MESRRFPTQLRRDERTAEIVAGGGSRELIAQRAAKYGLTIEGEPRVDRLLADGVAHQVGPFAVETTALHGHTADARRTASGSSPCSPSVTTSRRSSSRSCRRRPTTEPRSRPDRLLRNGPPADRGAGSRPRADRCRGPEHRRGRPVVSTRTPRCGCRRGEDRQRRAQRRSPSRCLDRRRMTLRTCMQATSRRSSRNYCRDDRRGRH